MAKSKPMLRDRARRRRGAGRMLTDDAFRKRLSEIKQITPEEQIALARRAKAGDQQARCQLIESCMQLGVEVAAGLGHPWVDPEHLLGEAMLIVVDAVDHFDPDRGYTLSTYVVPAVYRRLCRMIVDTGHRGVLVPIVGRRQAADIANGMGCEEWCEKWHKRPRAYHQMRLAANSITGRFAPPSFCLAEQAAPRDKSMDLLEIREYVASIMQVLTPHQRETVEAVFGLDGKEETSVEDIARKRGQTKKAVWALLCTAREWMRREAVRRGDCLVAAA